MADSFEEIEIPYLDEKIIVRLRRPESGVEMRCLLLSFAGDRQQSLNTKPYDTAAELFLSEGHHVLSFDLPNHGSRINEFGEGITGFRNAFISGVDPFRDFIDQGKTVIDWAIKDLFAIPGKIAVCGTSRGGYMAFRLLAAESRIAAGAGFAPVTDWRDLSEFTDVMDRKGVAEIGLSNYADELATRPVYIAIGNHDKRVNTARCCNLYIDIFKSKELIGADPDSIDFYCTEDRGHSCDPKWYRKGAEFLLKSLNT